MGDLNRATILGRAGRDTEVRYTPAGKPIATLRLATTDKWKDKNTGEQKEATEWHTVVFFDRLAEVAGEYVKKGSQVYVEGKLTTRKWQDKDGSDRYSTEIRGENLQLLGGRSEGVAPRQQASTEQAPRQQAPKQAPRGEFADMDDDIPF